MKLDHAIASAAILALLATALRAQHPKPETIPTLPLPIEQYHQERPDVSLLTSDMIKGLFLEETQCGHFVDDGTFFDAVSSTTSGKIAFAMRWLDPRPGTIVHSAIFTGYGEFCIVTDGAVIDGKFIGRVMPNSLAISDTGLVAWEGEYFTSPAESIAGNRPHRGAFIGNRFAFELDERNATPANNPDMSKKDFIWRNELLVPRPGVVLGVSPVITPVRPVFPPSALPKAVAPQTPASPNAQRPQPAPKPVPKAATPKPAVTAQPKPQRVLPCPPFCPQKH
jgi:hypothetical protein